ncbi:TIGR01777 family oxidoreductase [Legionella erythra]|uniref:Nucleoside-diphosphate sugar epimerase n=1 Tax=Legionella erythra TaxID=448 RepID=A0A0W0TVS3_LEGER|nr:TIGR01777 family oxidoreductase [Legionella erythra]KTC99496.1 nucleoside-diphosphate sugar epimerase [Legionella erythra]
MKLLIAGASGFIGRQFIDAIKNEHQVTALGRNLSRLQRLFPTAVAFAEWSTLENLPAGQFDAVMNLSGHNIGASRWSEAVKRQIIQSRVDTTHALIHWIKQQQASPHFYCANAVGIYGAQANGDPQAFDEDTVIDEQHPKDYMQEIGVRWQQALDEAYDINLPVTITRFGVVLKRNEGMLKKLHPSFNLGLGSILGDGKQILSWVHYLDVVEALRFLLAHPALHGAVNITSPNPVSQAEFARALAKAMQRPLFLKTPAMAIKLLLGEMGEMLVLKGQRVIPTRLLKAGYCFRFEDITRALDEEYGA